MMDSLFNHYKEYEKFHSLFEEKSQEAVLKEELFNEQQELLNGCVSIFQDFPSNTENLTLQNLDMFKALFDQQYAALRNNIHSLEMLTSPVVKQTDEKEAEIYQSALMF